MKFTQNIKNLQALNFMKHANLKVGVLGGTFDPAHFGHLNISLQALKTYKFDYIIWLVANQNPLKEPSKNDIFHRAEKAQFVASHPKIIVSTAEYDFGCYYAYDSLVSLIKRFKKVNFTWLMGIDNVASFRKWHKYQEIQNLCDIIIFDRPCPTRLVNIAAFGLKSKGYVDKNQAHSIITNRSSLYAISSTEIRSHEQ